MEITDGLIKAFLLDGKGGGKILDWNGIRHWLPEQGALWVHLDFTNPAVQHWLEHESALDEIVAEALIADETRPRCDFVADGALLSLRGVNNNPGADPEDMVSLRIFTDGQRVISTRRRKLLTIADVAQALESGKGPCSVGGLITEFADRMVERMSSVISELDDRIDEIEEAVLSGGGRELQHNLLDLRREILKLRRYISPQRDALSRLHASKSSWLSDNDRLLIREANDKITRYLEDLDSARDRASVTHEALGNRLAEQLNSRMYVLSMVAALFLPLGFLTGLLGINVGGIPLADNPRGFLEVVVFLLLLVLIQIVVFRRKHWF